jgi:ribonuclease Z
MLSAQVDRDEPLYIYGPPKIAEYIDSSRKVLDMYINYEIVVKEITEPGIVYSGADFDVRAFPLNHTKVCYGYTLEEHSRPGAFNPEQAKALGVPCGPLWSKLQSGETVYVDGKAVQSSEVVGAPRKGRKFSFVTDTKYLPTIAPEVADSDLLVCEGMFEEELASTAAEKKHMTAKQAAQIAHDARAKKMALIHYSPRYTDQDLKILLNEAKSIFPESVLSRDRMVFPIEYED